MVKVREFRANIGKYLDLADGGEDIKVKRNGHVYTLRADVYTNKDLKSKSVYTKPKRDRDVYTERVSSKYEGYPKFY